MEIDGVDHLTGIFLEAARTELKLPKAYDLRIKGHWPDAPDDPGQSYGYNSVEVRLPRATSAEISRYELALQLTTLMDEADRKLVWMCAHSGARSARGPSWRRVGKVTGVHANTVRRRFERAMWQLWLRVSDDA